MAEAARQLGPQLRKELNCVAVNRRGCYVPDSNSITGIFSSKHVAQKLQQVRRQTDRERGYLGRGGGAAPWGGGG